MIPRLMWIHIISIMLIFFIIIQPVLGEEITVFEGGIPVWEHDYYSPGSMATSIIFTEPNRCVEEARVTVRGQDIEGFEGGAADIALITDLSSSMAYSIGNSWIIGTDRDCDDPGLYSSSTSKISLAKCLDKEFVSEVLDTTVSDIRIALVSYTNRAYLDHALTDDEASLHDVIDRYHKMFNTCISCGLDKAITEMINNGDELSGRTVVLMTDGVANRCIDGCASIDAETEALNLACDAADPRSAVSNGIVVHTIGFGSDADEDILMQIAQCTGGMFLHGNDPEALQKIYETIADEIIITSLPSPSIDIGIDSDSEFDHPAHLDGDIFWQQGSCPQASCADLAEELESFSKSCDSPPCALAVSVSTQSTGALSLQNLYVRTGYCAADPSCGDYIVGLGEDCDDGPSGSDGCTPWCAYSVCGDGIVQSPNHDGIFEQCEPGLGGADGCAPSCLYSYCGDGVVQAPNHEGIYEECDSESEFCINCQAACAEIATVSYGGNMFDAVDLFEQADEFFSSRLEPEWDVQGAENVVITSIGSSVVSAVPREGWHGSETVAFTADSGQGPVCISINFVSRQEGDFGLSEPPLTRLLVSSGNIIEGYSEDTLRGTSDHWGPYVIIVKVWEKR